jgi:hypothetical protein
MNCPTCGAANDADARFCAECGTPLENQDIEATMVGQVIEPADNDMTIMSTAKDLAAEAKTMSVDEAEVANFLADTEAETPPAPSTPPPLTPPDPPAAQVPESDFKGALLPDEPVEELVSDPSPPPPSAGTGGGGGNRKTIMIIVGAVLFFALVLCCCCSMAIGGALNDPDVQDILQDLSSLPFESLLI